MSPTLTSLHLVYRTMYHSADDHRVDRTHLYTHLPDAYHSEERLAGLNLVIKTDKLEPQYGANTRTKAAEVHRSNQRRTRRPQRRAGTDDNAVL